MFKNKIIVTGGAGFIGSHLVEQLVSLGVEVVVIDNLTSGFLCNLSKIIDNIDFIQANVEEFDFSRLGYISAIVHLAAQTSVPYSIENYYESTRINLLSTTKVIDFCKNTDTPLVYATSSAVYGGMDYGDDTSSNVDLISPYAVDKFVMELYTQCASQLYDLSSIGLRFFNVYGPRQDPSNPYSGVITLFINKLMNSAPVTVNGGHQTRDFVYVEDVCQCIMTALGKVVREKRCDVVNILTGRSITINRLLSCLQELIPNQSTVSYVDLPKGDPEKSDGNVEKMIALLKVNLADMISLEEGLNDTIKYFKQLMLQVESHEVI